MGKKVVKLILYSLCFTAAALFVFGLGRRFSVMDLHGFKLSENWQLAVFGLPFAASVGIYALVNAVISIVKMARKRTAEGEEEPPAKEEITEPEISENPVFLTKTDDSASEESPRRALTRAEKRRKRLLAEEPAREVKKGGGFGIFITVVCLLFCGYFSVWALLPHPLCYHNYAYNSSIGEGDSPARDMLSIRFYQGYSGKPYFLYSFGDGKEFKVRLRSSEKGEDEIGQFTLYVFEGGARYAKLLDGIRDRYTEVSARAEIKYYLADSHISVSFASKKTRGGETDEINFENKIYSFKTVTTVS